MFFPHCYLETTYLINESKVPILKSKLLLSFVLFFNIKPISQPKEVAEALALYAADTNSIPGTKDSDF